MKKRKRHSRRTSHKRTKKIQAEWIWFLAVLILIFAISLIVVKERVVLFAPTDYDLYLPFDSLSSGSTPDSSPNNYDGSCSGSACPTEVTGQESGGLDFDGINDVIDVGNQPNLHVTDMTIMAWVRTPSTIPSGWRTILEHNRGSNNWYGLWKKNGGDKFHFRWTDDDANGRADFNTVIQPNTWYHVAATLDTSTQTAKMYLNGNLDRTFTGAAVPVSSSGDLTIGATNTQAEFFEGIIDEVAIFDYVMNQSDIQDIVSNGFGGTSTTTTGTTGGGGGEQHTISSSSGSRSSVKIDNGYSYLSLDEGSGNDPYDDLYGYWSFDFDSGSVSYDLSDNNRDASHFGSLGSTNSGQYGKALDLSGSNGEYAGTAEDNPFSNQHLTVTAWIRINGGTSGTRTIVAREKDNGFKNFNFYIDSSDKLTIGTYDHCSSSRHDLTYNNALSENQWHHVAFVIEDTVEKRLYVDGSRISGGQLSGDATSYAEIHNCPAQQTTIGARQRDNGGNPFNGRIDEVIIFDNNALSDSEISAIYNEQESRFDQPGYVDYTVNGIGGGYDRLDISLIETLNFGGVDFTVQVDEDENGFSGETVHNVVGGEANGIDITGYGSDIILRINFNTDSNDFYTPLLNGDIDLNFYSSIPADVCGDGSVTGNEICELGQTQGCSVGGYAGSQDCASDCMGWDTCVATESCGDGIVNGPELCEIGQTQACSVGGYPGDQNCASDCSDFEACTTTLFCGDGLINGTESCESDLDCSGPETCSSCQCVISGTSNDYVLYLNSEDSISDGEATDTSPFGNDAICTTHCPVEIVGQVNISYLYDGSNDYLDAGNSASLDITNSAISVATWIRWDGPTGNISDEWATVISKGGYLDGYRLMIDALAPNEGTIHFQLTGTSGREIVSSSSVSQGVWHHIAAVYDGSKINIYIDGAKDSNEITTSGAVDSSPDNLWIGHSSTLSFPDPFRYPFNGAIDELAVFQRNLSDGEIMDIYLNGVPPPGAGPVCGNGIVETGEQCGEPGLPICGSGLTCESCGCVSGATLLMHLELDDTISDGITPDVSGNGNDGSCSPGTSCPSEVSGQIGGAFDFDGSNDLIEVADSQSFDVTSKLSISSWFKLNTLGEFERVVAKSYFDTVDTGSWMLLTSSFDFNRTNCGFNVDQTFRFRSSANSPALEPNRWYHSVCVYNGTNIINYLDGVKSVSPDYVGSLNVSSFPVSLGASSNGASGLGFIDGLIDDVRIYNGALSDSDVLELYNMGLGKPVLHLEFNDTISDGITPDVSGNGLNGTCNFGINCPSEVSGQIGGAFDFDGSSQYIHVSDDPMLQLTDMAIMAWVYLPGALPSSGWDIILQHGRATENWYGLQKSANGDFFNFRWSGIGGNVERDFNMVIQPNTWYHVVGVYDSATSTAYGYLNGQLDFAETGASVPGTATSDFLRIGADGAGTNFFPGIIDDVRIYDRSLGSSEVANIYAESTGILGLGLDIVSYLPFNDTLSDGITPDVSGNGNDGSCSPGTSCPSEVSGQIGGAFDFSGVEQHIALNNLDVSGSEISISLWAKEEGGDGNDNRLISKAGGETEQDHWWMLSEFVGEVLRFRLKTVAGCGTATLIDGDALDSIGTVGVPNFVFTQSNWFHAVATYDANEGVNGSMKLYANGVLIAESPHDCGGNIATNASIDAWIGDAPVELGADRSWKGGIDDVLIMDRALTANEVTEIYVNGLAGIGINASGNPAVCGDGQIGAGEICELGQNNSCVETGTGYLGEQTCAAGCGSWEICIPTESCGDGIVNGPELCEIGQTQACSSGGYSGTQTCLLDCSAFDVSCVTGFCGDGIVNGPEQCDDGGTIPGDGCDASCLFESCTLTSIYWNQDSATEGEIVTFTVEGSNCNGENLLFEVYEDDFPPTADEPANVNPVSVAFVGSSATGSWNAEWQCDGDIGGVCTLFDPEYYVNANLTSDNTIGISSKGITPNGSLSTTAVSPTCNNGIVDAGEECDDGNLDETDGCSNSCTITICGDTIVQSPNGAGGNEVCDSDVQACGNGAGNQSCLNDCSGYDVCVIPGSECSEGNTRDCPLQQGVCTGAMEICSSGAWPGCGSVHYGAGYEENVEMTCNDGFDNDCDGVSDCADSDCLGNVLCVSTDRLEMYLPFDDDIGDGATPDLSVNANDGTCGAGVSCPINTTGNLLGGFNFDGVGAPDTDRIVVLDNPSLTITNAISYGGWFRVDRNMPFQKIMSKSLFIGGSDTGSWLVQMTDVIDGTNLANSTQCGISLDGNFYYESDSVFGQIVPNTWNHVVCVYNGSNVMTYLNGEKNVNPQSVVAPISVSSLPVSIGAATDGIAVQGGFNGTIDEIFVFSRALSDSEVIQLYSGTLALQSGVCGDGILDSGSEECDDGNTVNGDGCSSVCENEASSSSSDSGSSSGSSSTGSSGSSSSSGSTSEGQATGQLVDPTSGTGSSTGSDASVESEVEEGQKLAGINREAAIFFSIITIIIVAIIIVGFVLQQELARRKGKKVQVTEKFKKMSLKGNSVTEIYKSSAK